MPNIRSFLEHLISVPGLTGYESPVAEIIEEAWRPLVDETHLSKLGSLHGLRCGTSPEPRASILLAAHMDTVGLVVAGIYEGFLRVAPVGDLDARILPGQAVTVHASGRKRNQPPLPGLVVQPHLSQLPAGLDRWCPIPLEYLLVDVGLPLGKVDQVVRIGDPVSFAQSPIHLSAETLAGPSMDNRASIAAVTTCLEELQAHTHKWDVWVAATTREEIGFAGAYTSAFQLRPQIAVIVDTTWASSHGAPDWKTFTLGKGPTLVWGPNIHPALHRIFKEIADEAKIPFAVEYTSSHSDTDAFATQVTGEGIPSMVICIPVRYMHTPVEVVAIRDIQHAGRLLTEFIRRLDVDFMDKIVWE